MPYRMVPLMFQTYSAPTRFAQWGYSNELLLLCNKSNNCYSVESKKVCCLFLLFVWFARQSCPLWLGKYQKKNKSSLIWLFPGQSKTEDASAFGAAWNTSGKKEDICWSRRGEIRWKEYLKIHSMQSYGLKYTTYCEILGSYLQQQHQHQVFRALF